MAKVGKTIFDWNRYIQPVLFAYRIKKLRITGKIPFELIYGRKPRIAQNEPNFEDKTTYLIDRLVEIIDEVPQL